jgi:hypothetical protein
MCLVQAENPSSFWFCIDCVCHRGVNIKLVINLLFFVPQTSQNFVEERWHAALAHVEPGHPEVVLACVLPRQPVIADYMFPEVAATRPFSFHHCCGTPSYEKAGEGHGGPQHWLRSNFWDVQAQNGSIS